MKNIILSLIVIALVGWAGHYLLITKKANVDSYIGTQSTAVNNLDKAMEDGTLPPAQNTNNQENKTYMITIETNYGKIVFATYNADAPNTVNNFITLANKGFYNGLTFHRVIPGFMIQGGDPNGNGTGGPGYQFADELNPATASYKLGYKKGVVAMANAGPNTNGSQFFIMTEDYPLPNAYTIFGKVISGQEVVDKIASVPRGANDKPTTPVVMKTVTVE